MRVQAAGSLVHAEGVRMTRSAIGPTSAPGRNERCGDRGSAMPQM
jgi:hypothetical protein